MSIPKKSVVTFTQQFANLIDAGISLRKALRILLEQADNLEFIQVIQEISKDIEGGNSLSQSFSKHPQVFSKFYISMLYAGESGSGLTQALTDLSKHLDKEEQLRTTLRKTFAYPIMLISLTIIMTTFLVLFIVPVFKDVYNQLNVSLPLPTLMLIAISVALRSYWWLIIILLVSLFFIIRRLRRVDVFNEIIDYFLMGLPLLGDLIKKVAVTRFVSILGDLLQAGVSMIESLDIASQVSNNREIFKAEKKIRASIEAGGNFSGPLEQQSIFPPLVVQMAYAGEESGTIGEMLKKCGLSLEYDIEVLLNRLIVVLEPGITIIMGFVVGFIALAIYLPMFDLVRLVTK